MDFPATISIKPSRRLRAALVFLHLLAGGSLFATLPIAIAGSASVVLVLSLWRAWQHQNHLALTLGSDASLAWREQHAGDPVKCEVAPGSTAYRWLVVLHLRGAEGRRTLLVLPDSATPADYRRLQIWLRWVLPFKRAAGAG